MRKASRFAESPDFIAAMRRRLGETPEQQLEWVVNFAAKDFDALRSEELVALGYDLLMIAAFSLPRGSPLTTHERRLSCAERVLNAPIPHGTGVHA